jgi:rare lipoprotein A
MPTTKMTAWWRKAVSGICVALLVGCATLPGEVGKTPTSVSAGRLLPSQVAAPPLLENKANAKSTSAPVSSPVGLATLTTNPDVQMEPLPSTANAPVAGDAPWTQRGRASWYGRQFNGRRTANGERFNAMALTAAHRSLPMPSYARVRVVGSSKEVVVRINDRGPFHAGRVLDLSYAAARQLGIVGRGTAQIEIAPLAADYVPDNEGVSDGTTHGVP